MSDTEMDSKVAKNGDVKFDSRVEAGEVESTQADQDHKLLYSIEDVPPWYLSVFLGLQHTLMMVGATISIPLILAEPLCIQSKLGFADEVAKSELISTIFMVSGIVTILQTTFGCRLPIVQGGTFSFLAPTFAILAAQGACPELLPRGTSEETLLNSTLDGNGTLAFIAGSPEHREFWQSRMRQIQGAIMISSLFQMLVGFSGLVGVLLRFIGPLTVTPTIALVGLALFEPATQKSSTQWGIAILTMVLIGLFSEVLKKVQIPCSGWSKGKGCHVIRIPFFRLFPVILAMLLAWILTIILTESGAIPRDHPASTSKRISVITDAAWFRVPYPGQWGTPTVTVAGVFGMLAGVLASIMESIGDYYAAARFSGAPPPRKSAINRGIGMEGVGCLLAGAFGTGNGTTSYSENIGAMGITRVGSRRVIQMGAISLIVISVLGKLTAVLVTIPDPVIGGMYFVMFSMVTAVGLANLQYVDLNSARNLFILGLSLMVGLALPIWVGHAGNFVQSGSDEFDQIVIVLLSTSMFVGGVIACFLDNVFPGTLEERGIIKWTKSFTQDANAETNVSVYDMPFGNDWIYRTKWTSYVPFSPSFRKHRPAKQDTTGATL